MKITLSLIINIYKKAAFIVGFITIVSFILFTIFHNFYNAFSFSVGSFLIFLNILGIVLIGKFAGVNDSIQKDKLIMSISLFLGKLIFLLIIIFFLIYFKLVNEKLFLGGLSLGFFIFFIANLIFIPLQIYKIEKIKE